jgi:3-hydroxymyristoyl/3-hydroxydecanoyl-(acyl carrier protein) dehydratase
MWSPRDSERTLLGRPMITRLIPHRPPFLLVDCIDAFSLEDGCIKGQRHVAADDPVFAGHFPGAPVYPGVLQLEMIGQLGLCLFTLTTAGGVSIPEDAVPRAARVLKIHSSTFIREVRPSDELTIVGRIVESNDYTAIFAGQILNGEQPCSVGVMEVYFVA